MLQNTVISRTNSIIHTVSYGLLQAALTILFVTHLWPHQGSLRKQQNLQSLLKKMPVVQCYFNAFSKF